MAAEPNTGSIICFDGTGSVPGIEGRLNPILDTYGRTYLYADNISVRDSQTQPAIFEIGVPFQISDRHYMSSLVTVLAMRGRTSLVQFTTPSPK